MFSHLAAFTSKYRIAIAAVWLAAAVCLFFFSPRLSEVGVTDDSQFLPADTESAVADRLLSEKFASTSETSPGSGIIIIHDENGLDDDDILEAATLRDWLVSEAAPREIVRVVSVYDNEAMRSTLISADHTTMMMIVDFSSGSLSDASEAATGQIRTYIDENYQNGRYYFTGKTGLLQDMFASVQETIDRTTVVTIVLVTILLLIIYRSPVAILLPLLAIGSSFAVSVGLVGFLGKAGVEFSTLAEAYLVVIIFGVGTDYCLFIVSRLREELRRRDLIEAQRQAGKHIGPVIAASALTVIVAFLSLGISSFGMNRTTGYAMAIGVAVTLVAGLTLVPALMSIFGRYLFWPSKTTGGKKIGGFGWHTLGTWVSRRPAAIALPIVVSLALPYLGLANLNRSSDVISQLPQSSESVRGFRIMAEHFPAGELSPTYVLIESKNTDVGSPASLKALEEAATALGGVRGVSRIDYVSSPAGNIAEASLGLRGLGDALGEGSGLDRVGGSFQSAGQLLLSLAVQYPGILQSAAFQQAGAISGSASALAEQLAGATPEALALLLPRLQESLYSLSDSLDMMVAEFRLEADGPFTAYLLATYFSADMTTAKINVILGDDPKSPEAFKTIERLRDAAGTSISRSILTGSAVYVGGDSAVSADIMRTNDADFGRVVGLSIAGILVVIIVLLRSLLAPLYMVATVLLNYGATLGIATWLFLDVMKQDSVIYFIPLFIFVILVALGADYNIFLVSRIREEAQYLPIREAVRSAVTGTGGVITACGIILAGTFATLMTSPLEVVFQIGAAISIGVLVDTFLVRALLVPAIATMAKRSSWWPSRLSRR